MVAAGASTVSAVRATCGAGTGCGGCLPSLRRLLRECLAADLACTAAATLETGAGLNLDVHLLGQLRRDHRGHRRAHVRGRTGRRRTGMEPDESVLTGTVRCA